jgi:nitrate ABC transporter ATP-binding subunit
MGSYVKEHFLDLVNLSKIYPTRKGPFVVLEEFNLTLPESEFVCLIGHSGCGKSTILTMVAGLNEISNGSVSLAGTEIAGPGPDRGVVFQAPSLLPWLSAYENVMLGVKKVYPSASKRERDQIVKYYLNAVGLGDAFDKMPKELSQGMRQRVGIARAFALKPKMMLLDEPLGMLDALTKHELQDLILRLHDEHKLTTLMVTHDVDEALYLSDRVVMMTNGPMATVGDILINDLPRPRERVSLLDHPNYYKYREHLIEFLESEEKKKSA